MSEPVLRRAVPQDAARLALLGGATFLHSFAHDHPGDALVAHVEAYHSRDWYSRTLADPACAAWILETQLGAPIGYALLTPPELDCPTESSDRELKRIYLLGPWQSGGWGGKLLAAVEEEAQARGAARLFLCVYSVNHGAQRFYARRGYAETGYRQIFLVGDVPFEDFIWAKQFG
ncbi:GNAT family N-acetyltransferase [Sphingomonas crusticola]|uniref:GNAT family N-acetyltransferase n=1 Tax=Sphingomonas crusticola TaxID=1697973 RepID=UPI000E2367E9|nr:GNAT family N-acetyltransferase [Sphingomonas crusticola]